MLLVMEIAAGGPAIEFPIDLDSVPVHAAIPGSALAPKRLEIRDSPGAKTLPRENSNFDFCLVEPTSVAGVK
jgi:hypothetical protein